MKLYNPQKYKVIVGSGSAALCTYWSDTSVLLKTKPEIKEKFSIIGTLYSREGVNIMLRNLCLNPTIQTVFLWANHPLSKTNYGRAGSEILRALWERGVDEEHEVIGTGFLLDISFDLEVIRRVIANVKLIDVSKKNIDEVMAIVVENKEAYMEPISFDEPSRDENAVLPSENAGWLIREKKLIAAWSRVVEKIMKYGCVRKTEYGDLGRELMGVMWIIENEQLDEFVMPKFPHSVCERIGLTKDAAREYGKTYLDSALPTGVSYTYGQRLGKPIDQIASIVKRLKENKYSRRAVATTLRPREDCTSESPPCLNLVQVMVDEKVHVLATFRSHDIFKASLANAIGLLGLQEHIAKELGLPCGRIIITSQSAHIYENDWEMARKLSDCAFGKQKKFDENNDIDPRGNVFLGIKDGRLYAELNSEVFFGATAREVIMELASRQLLSRADHYADLAIELVKAEVAMKRGVEFVQDRPLRCEAFTI